ncbi:CBU_0592 family membrane protein [Deinococcus sp.]|uniref:CBU_0592 family membrane protein n=1 Tax=Deinococcus sp. TaxID=47478 RepID=UPI003B5BFEC7
MDFIQLLSLLGAAQVLSAFIAAQFGKLSTASVLYLLLNTVGGACLAVSALLERNAGFIVLEGTWTLVSAWGLLRGLTKLGQVH